MDIVIDFVHGFLVDRNEDDAFDRLNYQITPFLFVLFSLINISKVYMGTGINCFTKAEFKPGWIQYTHDYCLIENTYYLRTNESIPLEQETRGPKYISYYQWVPFILVLQACSFYLPHLAWRSFNWITGFQIRAITSAAKESVALTLDENKEAVRKIARSIYYASQLKHRTLNCMNEQKFVTALYLSMKFSYLLLICLHLAVFQRFIGSLGFALNILQNPGEWEKTSLFPRVTVCDFEILRYGQPLNYTVECVLPLNMFNEKIFVFFFFWLVLLFSTTLFSIALWLYRLWNRRAFFRSLLTVYRRNDPSEKSSPSSPESDVVVTNTLTYNAQVDFGCDLRVVLGLIQDHTGLLFCSNVFFEMVNLSMVESTVDDAIGKIEKRQ
ncbi:Innexin family-containing protein [Aphelenchoides fujianensis]|nr:Innexin family-containing protein [Aphelenchoides fujianensis]